MKNQLVLFILILFINFTTNLSYASDSLDHQRINEVSEFCDNNEQASELCDLLAQDVLDYQSLDYDLQLNNKFSDYAQSTAVVSVPVFLRYLPALARLAKNNMIVASSIALVSGAIVFKKYLDSLTTSTLMIQKEGSSGSSPLASQTIEKLNSSKRFQYYSQKGPEHENDILIPYLQQQEQDEDRIESNQVKEFQEYIRSAKQWYKDNPISDQYSNFKEIINDVADYPQFPYLSISDLLTKISQFNPNELSEFEKNIAQKSALRFFNQSKLTSSHSTYYNTRNRNIAYDELIYKELEIRLNSQFSHITEILIVRDKHDRSNKAYHDAKKIWNALLLEYISHLELLETEKSPIFEQEIYIPFLQTELQSLNSIINTNDDELAIYNYPNSQNGNKKVSIAQSSPLVYSTELQLPPSQYLIYQGIDLNKLHIYLNERKKMLTNILSTVKDRINVWNRQGEYKFLPGIAMDDQAFKDWSELFYLATSPLLNDLYDQEI